MSDLLKKMQDAYDRFSSEAVGGLYGQRYFPSQNSPDDDDNPDNTTDFPYVHDPEQYKTHVPLEKDDIREQDEEPKKPIKAGEEAGEDVGKQEPPPVDDSEGGVGDMGMDAAGNMPGVSGDDTLGAMGQQQEEEKLTLTQIGRVYELKKIYSRLSSVESFLSRTTDENILEVRKLVSQSIDLFELVISNFDQYKDKVDEIIVTYYEFLQNVYESIKKHFSSSSKE